MMTSCYLMADSGKHQLPDSTKNVSEFVNLLIGRLDQSENDVDFVILMVCVLYNGRVSGNCVALISISIHSSI